MNSKTRVVLALGSSQTLAWGSTYYLPAILAEPMARELGISTGLVFVAFSAALVISAIFGPMVGRRIDARGGRGVLTGSSLILALGLAGLAVADSTLWLFCAWLVMGVGMAAGLYDAAFSTLAAIYGREARGAITGITLIAGLASTICWPISALLEAQFGWRETCLFWAVAHLAVCLPLNRFLVPAGRRAEPPAGRGDDPGRGPVQAPLAAPAVPPVLAERRIMMLLAFIFTATWFTATAMAAHLPRLLQEAGATPSAAIAAAALVGPAQVAGRLLEFGLLRNFHPMLSARLALLAHPLGGAILLVAGAPVAMVFTLLHGAGNGIMTIAKGTLPLAIFGPEGYGRRQGVLSVPTRIGQALSPALFAVIIDRWGASALLLTMALGLAALAALMALPGGGTRDLPDGRG